jgi:CubicO group peptidase (beta-lactamase class C family)
LTLYGILRELQQLLQVMTGACHVCRRPFARTRVNKVLLGPSVGSYGWRGFYGTAWYNDPAQDMTTIVVMQRADAGDQELPMWNDFWTAAYQAIDD